MNKRRAWQMVIDRDKGLSIRSGKAGSEVHHIVRRGDRATWEPRNMIVLTQWEHQCDPRRASLEYKFRDLSTLVQRYGYDYSDDLRWQGIIDWGLYVYGGLKPW